LKGRTAAWRFIVQRYEEDDENDGIVSVFSFNGAPVE
jgi:hypothetical protein